VATSGSSGKPLWEHDLDKGLRALRNGLETHLITLHTVLPLLVRRGRGLVVEVTDGDDTFNERYRGSMFFDLIKVAITRLGRMLSEELDPHGVTSVSLTPGFLRSEAMLEHFGVTEENWRDGIAKDKWFAISETPHYIGRAVVALASDPDRSRWAGKALSSGLLAKHYGFTDVDGSQPEASRYSPTPTSAATRMPTSRSTAASMTPSSAPDAEHATPAGFKRRDAHGG
jgi:NAD(P)-dependent dehydrogenase (short-subunit alcohol dehydrogenase family)